MIDRMAEERMKPAVQGEDVFDKNNPITGKVGFWRDEINGIREFTDLEEALDLGGLENDGDFRKYLVQKNRGRFDSKGNFISASEDDLLPGEDTTSVVDHVDEKLKWKETGTNSYAKYAKSAVTAQADQKPRKYPNWEFPMCNYPRWIHQMYRMDQVKIGQLVKQGYGSPKYCSPWDICRDQGKNSEVTSRNDLSKNSTFDQGSNQDDKLTASQIGGQKTGKHSRALRQVKRKQGRNAASRGMNNAEGPEGSKITFGLDEFLENFEKEQQELSKLETDSYGRLIQQDEFGDITDLINEYQRKLTEEDDILKEAITRRRAEAKEKMIKRRQEAERKASAALQKKKLQEESQKRQRQREKDSFGAKKESLGRSTRYSGKSSVHFIRTDSSDRREAKRRPPPIVICRRIESWPIDKTKEIECMDRFNVLLRNQQDRAVSQEKFIELAKQIPPLVQSAPPKKLTPCEKLKPLVANGLD
ncbi:unnamed protein product [Nesidiocoris tenuis]|uniref:Uncharacterized protein n=1 Tax=Nesidiocoris tenuis TaxID=355587 RepID=A0A6H5HTF5_9HEMI|nr:unnamed protein product [Nesidiocoris tenuis]